MMPAAVVRHHRREPHGTAIDERLTFLARTGPHPSVIGQRARREAESHGWPPDHLERHEAFPRSSVEPEGIQVVAYHPLFPSGDVGVQEVKPLEPILRRHHPNADEFDDTERLRGL